MRDWKQEVRARLADLAVEPSRHGLIADEVAEHLEDRHASLIARGYTVEDADAAVWQELNESDLLKRGLRQVERMAPPEPPAVGGRARWLSGLRQDVRYGLRTLRRSPGFTAVACLTLALGVGATTAIFTVLDAVMLRPLAFQEPDRLVRFWESNPAKGWPTFSVSHPTFLDWRAQNRSFERMAAQTRNSYTLTGSGGDAEIVTGGSVTVDFLPLLGVSPALGRNFREDEDKPGGPTNVVLVTDRFWQRRFDRSPAILGRQLVLDGRPREIIGVLPASFRWGSVPLDVLMPLAPDPARGRGDHRLLVIGRLKPGVSLDQAREDMSVLAARIARDFPASNGGWSVALSSFYDWLVPAETRQSLLIMQGAVALVLLIACGNVASLVLARASARHREFVVRSALGAGRSRLVRQLLVEAVLLALAAAAAGLFVAWGTTRVVVAAAPTALPRLDELTFDLRVVGFGVGVALVSAAIFGLLPALHASRPRIAESLKDGSRGASGGRVRQRVRRALVVAEVALSVALLIGAGLLLRSFWQVQQVSPGFDADRTLTFRLTLPRSTYDTPAKTNAFYTRTFAGIAALPGVRSVATGSGVPLTTGNTSSEVSVPGLTLPAGVEASADWRLISRGYFQALGIPLRGRDFEEADGQMDDKGAPLRLVTIVSEAMARRYWPGQDPIGKQVILRSFGQKPHTVIGVAGDVRSFGLDAEAGPMAYAFAMVYSGWNPMSVVVRADVAPETLLGGIRGAIQRVDPAIPLYEPARFDELLAESLGTRRFNTYLLACFAGIALLLASVGLFGVLAYLVAQRTRDIGIRMALGANRAGIFRLVIGEGMTLAIVGAAAGIAGGIVSGRLLEGLLFSVSRTDVATFAAVPSVLLLVALAACYAPARRATRVDPLVALRAD